LKIIRQPRYFHEWMPWPFPRNKEYWSRRVIRRRSARPTRSAPINHKPISPNCTATTSHAKDITRRAPEYRTATDWVVQVIEPVRCSRSSVLSSFTRSYGQKAETILLFALSKFFDLLQYLKSHSTGVPAPAARGATRLEWCGWISCHRSTARRRARCCACAISAERKQKARTKET